MAPLARSCSRVVVAIALAPLWGQLCCCSRDEPVVDLEAPRLVRTNLPESPDKGAVSPTLTIRLEFSEPLDAATVNAHTVVVVPHMQLDTTCELDFACGEDTCYGGRCQRDRITSAWLSDLSRPPLSDARRRQSSRVDPSLDATGTVVRVEPLEPLDAHRLHTLLVSSAVTDRGGAPLETGDEAAPVRMTFATGPAHAARPTIRLRSPPPGTSGVPTNLARVIVEVSEPVSGVAAGSFWLERRSGGRVGGARIAVPSTLCRGSPPGTCFELSLRSPLPPLEVVRLKAGEGIADLQGQPAMPPLEAFATGTGPDHEPPQPPQQEVRVADGCVVLRLRTEEATDLWIESSWGGETVGGVGAEEHEVALELPDGSGSSTVKIHLQDVAGNGSPLAQLEIAPRSGPRIAITEVLANPAGPEPGQEFVELLNLSGAAVDLRDWIIDDNDDGIGANPLPGQILLPGQYAVVVGKGYKPLSGLDPAPSPAAVTISLDATLGGSGLSNAGEEIVLRDAQGLLVSTFGNHHQVNSKSFNGRSIERVPPAGCDVAGNWRPNPDGRSTPGGPPE